MDILEPPYGYIADGLIAGDVVPFFGAAASAVYRPKNEQWDVGKPFMPFGEELATVLALAAKLTDAQAQAALAIFRPHLASGGHPGEAAA